jgi:hypothetical protein
VALRGPIALAPVALEVRALDVGVEVVAALGDGNDVVERRSERRRRRCVSVDRVAAKTAGPAISLVDPLSIYRFVADACGEGAISILAPTPWLAVRTEAIGVGMLVGAVDERLAALAASTADEATWR